MTSPPSGKRVLAPLPTFLNEALNDSPMSEGLDSSSSGRLLASHGSGCAVMGADSTTSVFPLPPPASVESVARSASCRSTNSSRYPIGEDFVDGLSAAYHLQLPPLPEASSLVQKAVMHAWSNNQWILADVTLYDDMLTIDPVGTGSHQSDSSLVIALPPAEKAGRNVSAQKPRRKKEEEEEEETIVSETPAQRLAPHCILSVDLPDYEAYYEHFVFVVTVDSLTTPPASSVDGPSDLLPTQIGSPLLPATLAGGTQAENQPSFADDSTTSADGLKFSTSSLSFLNDIPACVPASVAPVTTTVSELPPQNSTISASSLNLRGKGGHVGDDGGDENTTRTTLVFKAPSMGLMVDWVEALRKHRAFKT